MNSFARRHDTAVILHLFYADLWPEVCRFLGNIPDGYDLYVTTPEERHGSMKNMVLADVPNAIVLGLPNRGRDIAPFLDIVGRVITSGYKRICKIHSKKSLHCFGGDRWRTALYEALMGSEDKVRNIFTAFGNYPGIGIIGPAQYLFDYGSCSVRNNEKVEQLSERMGIQVGGMKFSFFAGSMFWFRPGALKTLVDLGLDAGDFEPEAGQADGTLAHAVERVFLLAVATSGYCSISTDDLEGDRLAAVGYSDPMTFPPGKKCHISWLQRSVLASKALMKVRAWIADSRS